MQLALYGFEFAVYTAMSPFGMKMHFVCEFEQNCQLPPQPNEQTCTELQQENNKSDACSQRIILRFHDHKEAMPRDLQTHRVMVDVTSLKCDHLEGTIPDVTSVKRRLSPVKMPEAKNNSHKKIGSCTEMERTLCKNSERFHLINKIKHLIVSCEISKIQCSQSSGQAYVKCDMGNSEWLTEGKRLQYMRLLRIRARVSYS
ncbi:hypothetical protein EVAR_43077_1 [Eumeta japonica]|uniref:Uncharacterized protein n=1 Tax=Eumeta variegata TaxID=151549 RepID=A0A4C1WXD5_EUMVA|nr:hypothetical protein EVAR_43077_1 [Eumeta japonica]